MPYLTKLPSGKWRAVYRSHDGRRHSITRPTKDEARIEALERESEIRRGSWHDPDLGKISFELWHEKWLRRRVVEGNTIRKNASHMKNHILPRWRKIDLAGIYKQDVQEWVADMQRDKVGPETINAVVTHFGTILQGAVDNKPPLIQGNPARGLVLPESPKEPFRILDDDEAFAIFSHLTDGDERMCRLDHRLGLRWGELAGLHTHRVNLDRRELYVVEVLTRHDGIKEHPKSKKSFRTLPLTDAQAEMLKLQMEGLPPRSLVFKAANGGPLDYTNWRRRVWLPAVEKAKLAEPQPTIHDLRHTCASNLVEDGVDLASVQAFMGHESLRTTERYVHVSGRSRDRIRAVLEARDTRVTHGAESDPRKPIPD